MADDVRSMAAELIRGLNAFMQRPPKDIIDKINASRAELDVGIGRIQENIFGLLDALLVLPGTNEAMPILAEVQAVKDIFAKNSVAIAKAWKLSKVVDVGLQKHLAVKGRGVSKWLLHEKIVNAKNNIKKELDLRREDLDAVLRTIDDIVAKVKVLAAREVVFEERKLHEENAMFGIVKALKDHFSIIRDYVGAPNKTHPLATLRNSLNGIARGFEKSQ